jgi:arylsulfatase A-like enzyme
VPTALAAAGVSVAPEWRFDGVNLLPYLIEATAAAPHDSLYWRLGGTMAARIGDWKLVRMSDEPLQAGEITLRDLLAAQLYNLRDDIGEEHDIAATNSVRVREMAMAWMSWNADLPKPRFGGAKRP